MRVLFDSSLLFFFVFHCHNKNYSTFYLRCLIFNLNIFKLTQIAFLNVFEGRYSQTMILNLIRNDFEWLLKLNIHFNFSLFFIIHFMFFIDPFHSIIFIIIHFYSKIPFKINTNKVSWMPHKTKRGPDKIFYYRTKKTPF